jgi:hypothetical protein
VAGKLRLSTGREFESDLSFSDWGDSSDYELRSGYDDFEYEYHFRDGEWSLMSEEEIREVASAMRSRWNEWEEKRIAMIRGMVRR